MTRAGELVMRHNYTPMHTANAKKPAAATQEAAARASSNNPALIRANATIAPIEAGDCTGILPEFGRLPDVQRLFGLKRGFCYQLINSGKIRSVSLRRPGARTGCRLIHLQSVRDFLHEQMVSNTDGDEAQL